VCLRSCLPPLGRPGRPPRYIDAPAHCTPERGRGYAARDEEWEGTGLLVPARRPMNWTGAYSRKSEKLSARSAIRFISQTSYAVQPVSSIALPAIPMMANALPSRHKSMILGLGIAASGKGCGVKCRSGASNLSTGALIIYTPIFESPSQRCNVLPGLIPEKHILVEKQGYFEL
jgi:hypothetical protein